VVLGFWGFGGGMFLCIYIVYPMKKCPPGVICIENVTLFLFLVVLFIVGFFSWRSFGKKEPATTSVVHHERVSGVIVPPPPPLVPVNIPTNVGYVDSEYRQIGILTPLRGGDKNKILPLYGRPLFVNRQKWQYYSMSDQNHRVRLPVRVNGRSASNDYGVDEVYGGDRVFVEGYNHAFVVTMYENSNLGVRYL
jgi:hypothetical protein